VKVAGILTDIHATSSQFSATLCFVWSLTIIFIGFISNVGGLYTTRLILAACEAGLFPCLNLYLAMVYRREEQAKE
jgi:MFS family permease